MSITFTRRQSYQCARLLFLSVLYTPYYRFANYHIMFNKIKLCFICKLHNWYIPQSRFFCSISACYGTAPEQLGNEVTSVWFCFSLRHFQTILFTLVYNPWWVIIRSFISVNQSVYQVLKTVVVKWNKPHYYYIPYYLTHSLPNTLLFQIAFLFLPAKSCSVIRFNLHFLYDRVSNISSFHLSNWRCR